MSASVGQMALTGHLLVVCRLTTNFVKLVLSGDVTKVWRPRLCNFQLVGRRSTAEQSTNGRSAQDTHQLGTERARADAVQREVDAVVETVRHRGYVLGRQQDAGKTNVGTRGRRGVEVDMVEEQSEPAYTVGNVEDDEGCGDDEQENGDVVVAMTCTAAGLQPRLKLLLLLLLLMLGMVMMMMIVMVVVV